MKLKKKEKLQLTGSLPEKSGSHAENHQHVKELKELADGDVQALIAGQVKYGDSWRKRGGWEAFANLSRKWDRIERSVLSRNDKDIFLAVYDFPSSDGSVGGKDGLLDDLRDLRRYLMLVEEYILRMDSCDAYSKNVRRL